jgi:two-component system response regulator YesN
MDEKSSVMTPDGGDVSLRMLDVSQISIDEVDSYLQSGTPDSADEVIGSVFARIGDGHMNSLILRTYIATEIHIAAKKFTESMGIPRETFVEICGSLDDMTGRLSSRQDTRAYVVDLLEKCVALRCAIPHSEGSSIVEDTRAYINEHFYEERLSLEGVARSVSVSASYLSFLFKKVTGVSFVSYVTSVRIQKAKELLCCSSKKICDIAGSVGYSDYHYFCSLFKRKTGCSPSEFRAKNNKQL